jgi:hypothetical protein
MSMKKTGHRPTYQILERRNRWHVRPDGHYRECIARRSDGALRVYLVREDAA